MKCFLCLSAGEIARLCAKKIGDFGLAQLGKTRFGRCKGPIHPAQKNAYESHVTAEIDVRSQRPASCARARKPLKDRRLGKRKSWQLPSRWQLGPSPLRGKAVERVPQGARGCRKVPQGAARCAPFFLPGPSPARCERVPQGARAREARGAATDPRTDPTHDPHPSTRMPRASP